MNLKPRTFRVAAATSGMAAFITICLTLNAASPRQTATVKLIEHVEPAVVAIFADLGEGRIGSGSGAIIHEDGYILSNHHVVQQRGLVLLKDAPPLPYRVIGSLPEKDLAIVKIKTDKPLPTIPLGRTHDLKAGEPILVAGNPGGRGIVFSCGIVSSPSVIGGNLLALVSSRLTEDTRDRFIQFDAASNRGNSGGPLINAEGRQIGVVSSKNYEEENINYAIPIDRFRELAGRILEPEARYGIHVGMQVDAFGPLPTVVRVEPASPAARAGFEPGDTLQAVNGRDVRHGTDWLLSLIDRKPGDAVEIFALRQGQRTRFKLEVAEFPLPETVAREGRVPGLRYSLLHGEFGRTTALAKSPAVKSGDTNLLDAEAPAGAREDFYGLIFTGYLEVPEKGLYRFTLNSDDGSRLFLGGKILIDNDGRHPEQEFSGLTRLNKGLVPLRVEYFEGYGDAKLELFIQPAGGERRLVGAEMLFRDEEDPKADKRR